MPNNTKVKQPYYGGFGHRNSRCHRMKIGKNTNISDLFYNRTSKSHTSPVQRRTNNDGLQLHANKQYLANELRKERLTKNEEL